MTTAIANREKLGQFNDYFKKRMPSLTGLIPKHLTGERIMKIAIGAIARNPLLMQSTPESVWLCVANAATLGLEVGALGAAYLVPFRNGKTGKMDCQMIPGYQGLIDLCRRSGHILSIEARAVHKNDVFDLDYGNYLSPIIHKPCLDGDRGDFRLAYAVARLKESSAPQIEVMTKADIERIRARSRAGQTGPWVTDYEEMARKTVVRRLVKYLPKSIELAEALSAEDRAESGQTQFVGLEIAAGADELVEAAVVEDSAPESKTDKVRADLQRRSPRRSSSTESSEPSSVEQEGGSAPTEGKAESPDNQSTEKVKTLLGKLSFAYDTYPAAIDERLKKHGFPALMDMKAPEMNGAEASRFIGVASELIEELNW